MTQSQTGEERMQIFSEGLYRQLLRMTERFGLDTVQTEELMALASTATASHTQNITQVLETLMSGLKASPLILNDEAIEDGVLAATMQAHEGVRYAAVLRSPGRPTKVIAYARR